MDTVPSPLILKVVLEAAAASRATAGRRGLVIELPDSATELVVAGDLHGNIDNLRKIVNRVNLQAHPNRHLVLHEFVHGSGRFPKGGCTSHLMLDAVAALKVLFPDRVHLLPGNHELSQWTGRVIAKEGVALNQLFEEGIWRTHGDLMNDFIDAYDELIASMPLAVRTANRIFVSHTYPSAAGMVRFDVGLFDHELLPTDQAMPKQPLHDLLWGRDYSLANATRWSEMVDADWLVTGHVAQPHTGYAFPNERQVVLDCVGHPASIAFFPTKVSLDQALFQRAVESLPLDDANRLVPVSL